MSRLRQAWEKLESLDSRRVLMLLVACIAALAMLTLLDVLSAWSKQYSLELESKSFQHQEEVRKLDMARDRDRLALQKERRELGLDGGPSTQPLEKLGDIFLRVGPYALLFFSIAQAWKVFEDQRSSRLRLALSVAFSVVVVGFVLIVGGYVTPTALKVGFGKQQIEVTSESLGVIVVVVGAVMFLASLLLLRPKQLGQDKVEDEA